MDIWLPFRHEGQDQVLRIITRVGELPPPDHDTSNPSLDKLLTNLVKDEWTRFPGRPVKDFTVDRLEPLAEVTSQFRELPIFTELDRRAVLIEVGKVIPSLEKRRDDGYEGPGEDIRGFVDALIEEIRVPKQPPSRRTSRW